MSGRRLALIFLIFFVLSLGVMLLWTGRRRELTPPDVSRAPAATPALRRQHHAPTAAASPVSAPPASPVIAETARTVPTASSLIVTLPDPQQRQELLQTLAARGFTVRNQLPQFGAFVVHGNLEALRRLLEQFPAARSEPNQPLLRPDYDRPRTETHGTPFHFDLLPWLGLDPATPNRGQNVTIAILDEPVAITPSTANANITQHDIFQLNRGPHLDGHGSAVSAIIAADSPHLQGIAPAASIISIPVLDTTGNGSVFQLAAAITAATQQGAHIISLSLGTETPSQLLQLAIDDATGKGVVIVAAAGNNGDNRPFYPASCDQVIAVAACDANASITNFSNFGPHIDIAAPGLDIVTDSGHPDGLVAISGTSAAAPCVAATIATILAETPELTPQEAADIVLAAAIDGGAPGPDPQYGHGTLNYHTATHWNAPDFAHLSLAGLHLDLDHESQTHTPLIFSAQNSGNTTLSSLTLTAEANGQTISKTFTNVPPGQTVSATLSIPNDQRQNINASYQATTPDLSEPLPSKNVQLKLLDPP